MVLDGVRTSLIDTSRTSTFVKEPNEAGSRGFRLVFAKFHSHGNLAVLVQQPDGPRFIYSAVAGEDEGAKALVEARRRGAALVVVLGSEPLLILEEG